MVGVIPEHLMRPEVAHQGLTELLVVDSMHTRKRVMAGRADAFIVLPGGYGTFEEMFEMVTWRQLRLHAKPVGLVNVAGYFDHLLAFLETLDDFDHGRVLEAEDDRPLDGFAVFDQDFVNYAAFSCPAIVIPHMRCST